MVKNITFICTLKQYLNGPERLHILLRDQKMPHDVNKVQMIGFEIKELHVTGQDHNLTRGNIVVAMVMHTNHYWNGIFVRRWQILNGEKGYK